MYHYKPYNFRFTCWLKDEELLANCNME